MIATVTICLFLSIGCREGSPQTGHSDQQLNVTTSWLGNSLPGSDGWVIQAVDDIYVTPDGTVYTNIPWDEHGANVEAFKDGKFVAETRVGNSGGGHTVTANKSYIYFAGDKHRRGKQGIDRRDRSDIRDKSKNAHTNAGTVYGLAATDARVYASVPGQNKIKVYDEDLNKQASWSVNNPGELALDGQGSLWVLQDSARAIRFSPTGKKLSQVIAFPPEVIPADISVTPRGRLLVTDIGPAEQIRIYKNIRTDPQLAGTYGIKKGVFAAPTPGRKGPRRFYNPVGVGMDSKGNIYVANKAGYENNGATDIQSYRLAGPQRLGALNWQMQASLWIDAVGMDPTNENVVYGSGERFSMNYSKPTGRQATLQAYTTNRHWFPREKQERGATWIRELSGHKIMFQTSMDGFPIRIYHFDSQHGAVAVPCGRVGPGQIWMDANGNGRPNPDETQDQNLGSGGKGAWVDSQGTIWYVSKRHKKSISRFPLQGFAGGCPQYTASSAGHYDPPGNFTQLRRIRFYPGRDSMMILNGFTRDKPDMGWHGRRAGKVFRRYDHWRPGHWNRTWQLVPPFENRSGHNSGDGNVQAISVAGPYLFLARNGSSSKLGYHRGHISVYKVDSKKYVGWMEPGPSILSGDPNGGHLNNIGIIDITNGINAYRRSNGEYVIFMEDDWNSKNVMFQWRPKNP